MRIAKRQDIQDQIERYPQLVRVFALSVQEQYIREDGHHWVTSWQRRIAPMIKRWGELGHDCKCFEDAKDVFALQLEEFVALVEFERDACNYLTLVAKRNKKFNVAGASLKVVPVTDKKYVHEAYDHAEAADEYGQAIRSVIEILEQQREAAASQKHEGMEAYYGSEVRRMHQMIRWIEDRKGEQHVAADDDVIVCPG